MDAGPESLPDDIDALKAALVAARAEVASVRAQRSDDQALIVHLKLQIEKFNRDRYGPRSERTAQLLDQRKRPSDHTGQWGLQLGATATAFVFLS